MNELIKLFQINNALLAMLVGSRKIIVLISVDTLLPYMYGTHRFIDKTRQGIISLQRCMKVKRGQSGFSLDYGE